jgi:hypothetical protein
MMGASQRVQTIAETPTKPSMLTRNFQYSSPQAEQQNDMSWQHTMTVPASAVTQRKNSRPQKKIRQNVVCTMENVT